MFIQIVEAKVSNESGVRTLMQRWPEEIGPGAKGYLGTTAGFTDDGRVVVLARFESAEAARANSDRPEQGAWWSEMEKNLDGAATFVDAEDVRVWMDGGSDDAGFVQIMRGHADDVPGMFSMMVDRADDVHALRPEIIGGLLMDLGNGDYVTAVYFRSEDAAREGEKKEMPDDLGASMERSMGEVEYIDLHKPELLSPPS